MKQISKATGQIDKIQLRGNNNKSQVNSDSEEEFDFGDKEALIDPDTNLKFRDLSEDIRKKEDNELLDSAAGSSSNRKNRNNWGNKKDTLPQSDFQ